MIVFISGPYSGDVTRNMETARAYSVKLWRCGIPVICPHLNTFGMEDNAPYDVYINGYIEILKRCDIVFMIGDWKASAGATQEHLVAKDNNLPIFYENELHDLITYFFSRSDTAA